jgi:hypothetical protein
MTTPVGWQMYVVALVGRCGRDALDRQRQGVGPDAQHPAVLAAKAQLLHEVLVVEARRLGLVGALAVVLDDGEPRARLLRHVGNISKSTSNHRGRRRCSIVLLFVCERGWCFF